MDEFSNGHAIFTHRISPSYTAAMRAPIHPEEIALQRQADERWTRTTVYRACTANACGQNSRNCPCPDACVVSEPEEGPGLLVSKAFWIAGVCSVGGWIALHYLLAWLGWL